MIVFGLLLRAFRHGLPLHMPSRPTMVVAARILLAGFAVGVAVSLFLPMNGADITESIIGHGIAAVVLGGAGAAVFCVVWAFIHLVKFAVKG